MTKSTLTATVIATGVTLAAVFGSAQAAGVGLPADLARAAAEYDRAQIAGDKAALDRLLAADYVLVNGAAEVEGKAQFIAESIDPSFKLNPYVVERPVETVWDGGAVLAGEVRLGGTNAGKRFAAHTRFADVWAKRNGRWQVVFTEVTRFPAVAGKAKP